VKRRSVIDIIERFQTHHALQEEREMKNFHAPTNGAAAPFLPDKNAMPRNGMFETQKSVNTKEIPNRCPSKESGGIS
jgi:hypothetical protein